MGKVLLLAGSAFVLFALLKAPSDAKPASSFSGNPNHAMALCKALDRTGLTAAPCDYSGWDQQMTVTLNIDAGEGQSMCTGIKPTLEQAGIDLHGWTLFVKTPYSTGPVAFCTL